MRSRIPVASASKLTKPKVAIVLSESFLALLWVGYGFYSDAQRNAELVRAGVYIFVVFLVLLVVMLLMYRFQGKSIHFSFKNLQLFRDTLHELIIPYPYGFAVGITFYGAIFGHFLGANATDFFQLLALSLRALSLALLLFGIIFELLYISFVATKNEVAVSQSPQSYEIYGIPVPQLRPLLISFTVLTGLVFFIGTMLTGTGALVPYSHTLPSFLADGFLLLPVLVACVVIKFYMDFAYFLFRKSTLQMSHPN